VREPTLKGGAVRGGAILLFATLSGSVWAHHSGAMYDYKQSITLSGTVREFQWRNPHCFIQLQVPGNAQPREWSVEMGSTGDLFRGGWRPGTVGAGDHLKIVVHPTRDSSPAGKLVSATRSDGTPLIAVRAVSASPAR
jgi:hypothetical protein